VLKRNAYAENWSDLETLRRRERKNQSLIEYRDPGRDMALKQTTIAAVAKNSAKQQRLCRILYLLAKHTNARRILELGTSLGISTSYLYSGMRHGGKMISIEGADVIAHRAQENLASLNFDVDIRIGTFDTQLDAALNDLVKLDLVFLDGHHKSEPTLNYFEKILPYCHEDSVIVFDDIHWSSDMENCWDTIRNHKDISQTVDLYFMGLAFPFRKAAEEHFSIKI